jgi:hypothetical protein
MSGHLFMALGSTVLKSVQIILVVMIRLIITGCSWPLQYRLWGGTNYSFGSE